MLTREKIEKDMLEAFTNGVEGLSKFVADLYVQVKLFDLEINGLKGKIESLQSENCSAIQFIKEKQDHIKILMKQIDHYHSQLKEIAEGTHCSACSCHCHEIAQDALTLQHSESFTCPQCDRVSHNPCDIAEKYCGACHLFFKD